jgi:DNA transformation protein and related proteins
MTPDDLEDLFQPVIAVKLRRMFGGHGIYADGVMFGLEADGVVYLKADAECEPAFRAANSEPFTYEGANRLVSLGYWRLPEDAFEDPETLAGWVGLARGAARRAQIEKARRTRKQGLRRVDMTLR